jgi:putative transcriptional regulator
MKKGSITKFRLSPKKPPKTDWRAFDAMSEEERHQAALSDPDSQPATEAQLARARRIPTVRALRRKLKL